jgi:hypothetical protein
MPKLNEFSAQDFKQWINTECTYEVILGAPSVSYKSGV